MCFFRPWKCHPCFLQVVCQAVVDFLDGSFALVQHVQDFWNVSNHQNV